MLNLNQDEMRPNIERFSTVMSLVALCLTSIYVLPESLVEQQNLILGFFLEFDLYDLMSIFITLVSTIGALWFFGNHILIRDGSLSYSQLIPNLILPFLSTLVLTISLRQMERGAIWWVVYGVGMVFCGLIMLGEYFAIDPIGKRFDLTSIVLIALAYGLFLILGITLESASLRLHFQFPIVFIASAFVSFRTIYLRRKGYWTIYEVSVIALITAQMGAILYYLFINPIQFGILLTGLLYMLTATVSDFSKEFKKSILIEPISMLVIIIGLMILISFV